MRTVVEEGVGLQRGVLLYDKENNLWFFVNDVEVSPVTGVQTVWIHRVNGPIGEGMTNVPASWVRHMERFVAEKDRTPVGVCKCGEIIWKDMVKEP